MATTPATKRTKKVEAPVTVEAIKGFNCDLTCRGFQFEIGKEYSVEGEVVPCSNGFHACPVDTVDPLRVFGFYAPGQSRYCIVDQGGAASNSGYGGAAFSHAYGGKVMCEGDGQALYCTEFNKKYEIVSVACGITGQDGIKAGVWYHCRDGKLVEVSS